MGFCDCVVSLRVLFFFLVSRFLALSLNLFLAFLGVFLAVTLVEGCAKREFGSFFFRRCCGFYFVCRWLFL